MCKKFFLLEREWNFDETLSVVCEAVSVMVNYDDISDKALMYQLLVDCDETLTKEFESGNEMATAMFSRKKGKALQEAMRLTKMEAALVAKYTDGLPPAAVAISDAIALCQPDILLVDMLVVVAATECFRKAVTDFAAARPTNEGLQEYMQQATKDTLMCAEELKLELNDFKADLQSKEKKAPITMANYCSFCGDQADHWFCQRCKYCGLEGHPACTRQHQIQCTTRPPPPEQRSDITVSRLHREMHGDEEQVHQRFTATENERPLPILITPEGPKHMDEANIRMWLLGDPKKRTHQAMADEAARSKPQAHSP